MARRRVVATVFLGAARSSRLRRQANLRASIGSPSSGDGIFTADDAAYAHLRIWIDANHGGTTGPPGFVALRAYDEFDAERENRAPDFGLTPRDPLFKTLLLWTDTNHNGVAEEDELESLGHAGISLIALGYKAIDEPDVRGNVMTLQARVLRDNGKGAQTGRTLNAVRLGR